MHVNPNGNIDRIANPASSASASTPTPTPTPTPTLTSASTPTSTSISTSVSTSASMKVMGTSNVVVQSETMQKMDGKTVVTTGGKLTTMFSRFFSSKKEIMNNDGEKNKEMLEVEVSEIKKMMIEQTALVTKIHTKKEHVKNALSTISDNEEYRDYLLTELHNINFSRENFTECKPSSSEDVFIAYFGEHSLEFSNRASSFELRGEALKKMLSDNEYCTLYELLSKTFCTKDDSFILCALAPIKAKLQLLKDECAEDIYKQVLMQIKYEDFVGISLSEYLASIFPVVSDNKND